VSDISKIELQRLIQGCVASNRTSQEEIYRLYSPSLFSLCMRYSGNREEAEEILQDGFLKMFQFMHQFKNTGSFEGWARRIFINCSLQRYREKERKIKIMPLKDDYHLLAEVSIPGRLFERDLIRLIQALPRAYRMVFNLYVMEGLKHREIAELLNISEGTSKSNLFDARKLLKKHLIREFKLAK
jgi:RNA polymerase sigma-70 factor (ECF subfamily)